jgi:Protein of unknown function (DUF4065)
MQFDMAKLHAAILYVCGKCEPSTLGAVKLHKVLYYTDMLHYLSEGRPITGAVYRKRPFGPTCDQLLGALRELSNQNKIEIREVDFFSYKKKEYHLIGESDYSMLNASELAFIDEVVAFVCGENSAKSISEISHSTAWEAAEMGEELPYNSVYHIFANQVSLEALEWATDAAAKIVVERTRSEPMDYVDLAAFRSRVLQENR